MPHLFAIVPFAIILLLSHRNIVVFIDTVNFIWFFLVLRVDKGVIVLCFLDDVALFAITLNLIKVESLKKDV